MDRSPADALYTVRPAALAFGEQVLNTSRTLNFWLRNNSAGPLPIVSMELQGSGKTQFRFGSSCGASVAKDAECAIRVTFEPTSVGEKLAVLRIVAGTDAVVRTKPLSGTGVVSTSE